MEHANISLQTQPLAYIIYPNEAGIYINFIAWDLM